MLRLVFVITLITFFPSMASAAESEPACVGLEWDECAYSDRCTLDLKPRSASETVHPGYSCRSAEGICELGFRQAFRKDELQQMRDHFTAMESMCRKSKNCEFVRGDACWCPPSNELQNCECVSGRPPQCRKVK